jgi:hypothetical protein
MKLLKLLLDIYKDEYELNLKEGLTKTTNIDQSLNILGRKFTDGFKFTKNKGENTFKVTLRGVDGNTFDELLRYANNLGWFPSFILSPKQKGKFDRSLYNEKGSTVRFEAKFDEELVDKTPATLYHITPTKYADKILSKGLAPRSGSKASYHPERIYLSKNIKDVEQLSTRMGAIAKERYYTILKITTNKIPGGYLRLYKDPNYMNMGFYTLNNIPPQAIEKLRDIEN